MEFPTMQSLKVEMKFDENVLQKAFFWTNGVWTVRYNHSKNHVISATSITWTQVLKNRSWLHWSTVKNMFHNVGAWLVARGVPVNFGYFGNTQKLIIKIHRKKKHITWYNISLVRPGTKSFFKSCKSFSCPVKYFASSLCPDTTGNGTVLTRPRVVHGEAWR